MAASSSGGGKGGPSEGMINLCMAYEQRTLEALTMPFMLPVTIVTGFLGAGKTTLLKSLLTKKRNLRLAALVNDFGDLNTDVQLLALDGHHPHHQHQHQRQHIPLGKADRMKGLEGGCMCCAPSLTEGMRGEVWSLLQQAQGQGGLAGPVGEGAVDYLVIETSGVTDPEGVIKALDEKFGKMTRARLDSVVTVVDADALAATQEGEGGEEGASSVVLARQLACADVVLLNKADLVPEERLAAVEQRIRALNPLAQLLRTRYCDVPLQCVLDVELPTEGGAGASAAMTHEAAAASYTTRAALAESSKLRSDASRAVAQKGKASLLAPTPTPTPASASPANHLAADGLASVTFLSPNPLRLAGIQRFFAHIFPPPPAPDKGVVRAKGFLHTQELPGRRLSLSVSGRRRVHIRDEGPWLGVPRTELVLIGRVAMGFDGPALLRELEAACVEEAEGEDEDEEEEGAGATAAAHAARLRALIAENGRMEVLDSREVLGPLIRKGGRRKRPRVEGGEQQSDEEALPHWVDAVVMFRLTGAGSLGVTSEHLRLQHGVDLDALNSSLQEKVNMSGRPGEGVLLWPVPLPSEGGGQGQALCFAVGGGTEEQATRLRAAWGTLVAPAAAAVIGERMSHLRLCKCGH